jgi:proline iminopeptidase
MGTPDVSNWFFSDAGDARRYDHRQALQHVAVPTLVIGGDSDPVFSPAATMELADAFPAGIAQAHVLNQCGHGPARDRPDETLILIRAFLQRVGQTSLAT